MVRSSLVLALSLVGIAAPLTPSVLPSQTVSAALPIRTTTSLGVLVDGWYQVGSDARVLLTKTSDATNPRLTVAGGVEASSLGSQVIGQARVHVGDVLGHIRVNVGLERTTFLGETLGQPIRPFVLVGTDSTPSTPHDTLTPQQASERESSSRRVTMRALVAPVLALQSTEARFRWMLQLGLPRTTCCSRAAAAPSLPRAWIDADAVFAMSSYVGIELSAGSYRHLATSTVADGHPFTRLGIAIGHFQPARQRVDVDSASEAGYVFRIVGIDSAGDGSNARRVRLRVWSARASNVAVRRDFSSWSPLPLTAKGEGIWEAAIPMSAGLHSVSLTLDGVTWKRPDSLTAGPTDFDAAVAVLTVP